MWLEVIGLLEGLLTSTLILCMTLFFFSLISRLVKGRIENESDQLSMDAKKLQLLCEIFYECLQNDRFSRDRLARMMIGQLSATEQKNA